MKTKKVIAQLKDEKGHTLFEGTKFEAINKLRQYPNGERETIHVASKCFERY